MRFGISLPHSVLRRLREFGIAKGQKPGALIEDLVVAYLAAGGGRYTEVAPVAPASLERLVEGLNDAHEARERDHQELLRAVEVLSLALREFAHFWFLASAPILDGITDDERPVRMTRAAELYGTLTHWIADCDRQGIRLVRDLPREDKQRARIAPAKREPKKDRRP
ncbi:MAG: hypothetical protein JOZ69_24690 [Myxococcales bacterium]|nr:hypothetical protein [Myxococcales bacterium]